MTVPPGDRSPDLAAIHRLAEFEPFARERMAGPAYDYVAGGSWEEATLRDNLAAWGRYRLLPRVLVDVARVDTATTILGRPVSMPVAVAPMATHGLAHRDGEVASARAAAAAGVPFTLSTMSTRSIEAVAEAAPEGVRFFQLYVQPDDGVTRSLVERAEAAGYAAIVVTADLPVLGYRERDRRNRFELDVELGNFGGGRPSHADHGRESGHEALDDDRAGTLTWADLERIRGWTSLPLVLKGILDPADARLAVEHGAAAIAVSNHGGRQLDRAPAAIDVLEPIVEAVGGRAEVWVDGGVRRGLDVLVALGLGARAVLVGRPVMWSLAAGGEAGVARALAILRDELEIGLRLVGAPSVGDVGRDRVMTPR